MPGFNLIGIPNETFAEETAATAAAPPIKLLRVTDFIMPQIEMAKLHQSARQAEVWSL
jgi:hypothetical protein